MPDDYLEKTIKNKEYNSSFVEFKYKKYCRYCGKEMQHTTVSGSYHNNIPDDDYDYCDCDLAIRELTLEHEIDILENLLNQLENEGKRITDPIFRRWEYDWELERLNNKYKDVADGRNETN